MLDEAPIPVANNVNVPRGLGAPAASKVIGNFVEIFLVAAPRD